MRNKLRSQLVRAKNRAGKNYPKWRIKIFEGRKYLSSEIGYTDKGRTEEKAKEMLRELEHERHLQAVGIPILQQKPLTEMVALYLDQMTRKGGKRGMPAATQHVRQVRSKLAWWFKVLKTNSPTDIRLSEVEEKIGKREISSGTHDLYVQALKSFLNWCVKNEYLNKNPLFKYQKHAPAPTFVRRALTMDEFHRLLAVTSDRRALIYRIAVLTGMRRGELDSLKVGSVDWKLGKVSLEAANSKNRKAAEFYLPGEFLAELYAFSAGKRIDEKLLVNVSPSKSAQTMKRELRKAGVAVETSEGIIDFHSLRVTFLTLVNELGEDVKTVQELARHSDPRLTFGVYTKAKVDRLRMVVDRVHAQFSETNRDIPRLGVSHAGVTQELPLSKTLASIGSKQVWPGCPRADGHLKDIPSQTETYPDINRIKASTKALFESPTNQDIPSQTETENESRRRHALVSQIAEALSQVSEVDLSALLKAVHGLHSSKKLGAA